MVAQIPSACRNNYSSFNYKRKVYGSYPGTHYKKIKIELKQKPKIVDDCKLFEREQFSDYLLYLSRQHFSDNLVAPHWPQSSDK